jgi:hypothetical protein
VNDWQLVWLAVMAVSLFVMAAMQVGLALIALRLVKQVASTTEALRQDVKPLIEKTSRLVDDASRATALAAAQVERVERLLTSTSARLEETMDVLQSALLQPVRQGVALLTAVRAAMSVIGSARHSRPRHARDEEEALFVG